MNATEKTRYTQTAFMKLFGYSLLILFISLFTCFWLINPAFAATKTVLEKTFVRDTGKPTTESVDFTVPVAIEGNLKIVNGSSGGIRISSAVISLNGKEIVGPDKFNQNIATIEVPVQLLKGKNTLNVKLNSKPGGNVSTQITIQVIDIVDIPIVFNPDAFIINEPTQVRFQARINPDLDVNPESVYLYEVDEILNPLGSALCKLTDDGDLNNGDDIYEDGVFSCFATFLETNPKKIRLAVQVVTGSGQSASSPAIFLNAVALLTLEEQVIIQTTQEQAWQVWEAAKAQLGDTLEARNKTVEAIKNMPGVADVSVSEGGTIWIEYESGASGALLLNPEGTLGGSLSVGMRQSVAPEIPGEFISPPAEFSKTQVTELPTKAFGFAATTSQPTLVGNNKVLIWEPFADDPSIGPSSVDQYFNGVSCPDFDVKRVSNRDATVDSVKIFVDFGTIVVITHGGIGGATGRFFFSTGEKAAVPYSEQRNKQIQLRQIAPITLGIFGSKGDFFGILPDFISNFKENLEENSIVFLGACESSSNSTMVNAFINKGAKTYYGFNRTVGAPFAHDKANELFEELSKLVTTGTAYDSILLKYSAIPPFAKFTQSENKGSDNVAYSGNLKNGNFEKGNLTSWSRAGDARVIQKLGSFKPTEGSNMGIISTGIGFTPDSGSIEQGFCLPSAATKLRFNWNFNSEEFKEWCGSVYQDTFEVQLASNSGTKTLFRKKIDDLCGSVSSTSLTFGQSGLGCIPTPGVGTGTGGNDCKVWSTGWKTQEVDISNLTDANKNATLRFRVFDVGDSIFDSAVLLDKIEVVVP